MPEQPTRFSKPPHPKKLRRPDPDKKLSNCSLRQALESVYATFASVLTGFDHPPSVKLFEEDIPGMVFEVAVGAGWVDITEAALLPDETVREGVKTQHPDYKGRKLVLFGDLMVDLWYKEAFIAILEDEIGFHSHSNPSTPNELMDSLPLVTSNEEREALVAGYLDKHATDAPKIRVTDIPQMANVNYRDFKRWRKGLLKDSSFKSKRISILLRSDYRWVALRLKPKWWELSPDAPSLPKGKLSPP